MNQAEETNERQKTLIPVQDFPEVCRTIICQSPISTWIADKNGTNIFQNEAARRLFGVERDDEVVGKYNIFQDDVLIAGGFIPQIRKVFEEGIPIEIFVDYDFSRVRHVKVSQPTHRILRGFFYPLKNGEGRVQYVIVQHEDHTEKQKAEEALKLSEARYKAIVETQTELVCRFLPDNTITFVNEAYCRYFGKTREELIGHSYMPLIYEEDHKKIESYLASFSRENPVGTIEHRVIASNGGIRWQQWNDQAIYDEQGNLLEYQSVGRDITERKQVEEALRESGRQFRALFDAASDIMVILDNDARFVDANPVALEWFGLTKNELMGRRASEFVEPGFDFEGTWATFRQRKRLRADLRIIRPDGTIRDVEYNGASDILPNRHLVIMRDITERKQAEIALAESESRYRELVEQVSDMVWAVDIDGRYTYVSPVSERILGYPPDEVLGRTAFEFIIPEDREESLRVFKQAIKERKEIASLLNRVQWKNGSIRHLETSGKPIFDEQGNLIGYRGIDRDVTERIQAEEALRESEEKFRELVESMNEGLARTDNNYVFTFINAKFAEMLGRSPEEMIGHRLINFVHEDYHKLMKDQIARRKRGEANSYELVWRSKDGHEVYTLISPKALFDEKGNFIGSTAVLTDITERKRAEEALRESEERLARLVETTPDGITIVNSEGKITFANPAAEKVLGIKRDEITKRYYNDPAWQVTTVDGKPLPDEEMPFARVMRTGKPVYGIEHAIIRPDGSRAILSINAAPLRDASGTVAGMVATITDITEQKRAEKELQNRIEFESLITSISTEFIGLSSDEIDNGIIQALQKIGEFEGVDRSYVFLFSQDGTKTDGTYEWNAEGIEPKVKKLEGLSLEEFPWSMGKLRRFENVYVPSIEDMPPEASSLESALEPYEIKSFINVPMVYHRSLIGFLGFDSVKTEKTWSDESIALLRIIGEIFANALKRNRAEYALKKSEARFRATFDRAGIGMTIVDVNGNIVEANPAFSQFIGYSPEELPGMSVRQYAYLPDLAHGDELLYEMIEGKRDFYQVEKRYITKDGRVVWGRLTASIARNPVPEPPFIIGMIEDITERKQAEESLRLTQFAMDHAAIATFWIAPDAQIIYANDASVRSLGYTRDELLHMTVHDVDPNFPPEVWPAHWKELKERGSFTFESCQRTKDGNLIPVEITINYLQFGGNEYNMAFVRDITERKLVEQRERETEEHKREFYRRTLLAATEGKLLIAERDQIEELIGPTIESWEITRGEDLGEVRRAVSELAKSNGMEVNRIYDFVLAIGEATTNAFKHAGGGAASLHMKGGCLIFEVSDRGPGIEALTLPEVALVRGFSTARSLGMGYKAILSVADKVYLATGPGGTTVAIEMSLHPAERPLTALGLPDTWRV